MDSRAPKGTEWNDIVEALHALANTVTVRSHYSEGHPAIAQADAAAGARFVQLMTALPEVVVALVDGEFVVAERPLPTLRERLQVIADAMNQHEIEVLVFQRGVTAADITILGQTFAAKAEPGGRLRDLAQRRLQYVLLRFVGVKTSDTGAGPGAGSAYLVPETEELLVAIARSLGEHGLVNTAAVVSLAERIVGIARSRAIAIDQRAWSRTLADEAAHASNVAQMTAAMALELGYTERECIDVTAAALVHDVGHLMLPDEIRGIPEPLLDPKHRPVFRNHTYAGASLLLGAACPPLWVAVAFEHHRGVDGGGYPALMAPAAPHDLVRIVALANFIDRKRTSLGGQASDPDDVLMSAAQLEGRFFGPGMVKRFLRALGTYPPGTTVELSDRSPAVVTRSHAAEPLRPQVMLLRGNEGGRLVDLRETVAAEERYERSIVRAILPPLLLPSDVVERAMPAVVVPEAVDDVWSGVVQPTPDLLDQLLGPKAAVAVSIPPGAMESKPPPRRASSLQAAVIPPSLRPSPPVVIIESAPPPRPDEEGGLEEIEVLMMMGRWEEALQACELRLARYPEDAEAKRCLDQCRERLAPVEDAAPPPSSDLRERLNHVPRLAMPEAATHGLPIGPEARFVLTLIDGFSTVETIADASGLSEDKALAIFADLVERGVLALHER